jgi:hypothetical protein
MSTTETKPKPRPKTVEEWREARRQRYGQAGDKGGLRILPTKVLDSDAFNELSKSAKLVLILSLSQLDYWQKKKHQHQASRDSSIGPLRKDGRFSLPNNLLKERGIAGTDTIARVRKELVAVGFWEVVKTGSLFGSGVFRWSDRWLTYNQVPVSKRKQLPEGSKAPGYCHYPNIIQHNERKQATHKGYSSDLPAQQDYLSVLDEESVPQQVEVITELAG